MKRRRRILAGVLCILMVLSYIPEVAFAAETTSGKIVISDKSYEIAPDIVEREYITNNSDLTSQQMGHVMEVKLGDNAQIIAGYNDYNIDAIKSGNNWGMRKTTEQASAAEKVRKVNVVGAVNGDFFDMSNGRPSGVLVMNGTVIQKSNRPCFYIDKDDVPHISSSSANIPEGTKEAIGGAVVLVSNGKKVEISDKTTNPRTAIGIKADNTIVIYMVDGRQAPLSVGMDYSELADTMIDLGCVWALNLDGGGSSTFATQRAGDIPEQNDKSAGLTIRCSPSDGYERTVSSSLLVVSNAQSDGKFDHAVLSPNQTVYTPGSTIEVTAQGSDKSGAAATLPDGLTWKITKGEDLATIETSGANGLLKGKEGKTGAVTVGLFDGSKSVGETSIELQWPDKLGFTNNSVSLDFGESSDLSFSPTWKGREVNYKDGDFEWTLEPSYYKHMVEVEEFCSPVWAAGVVNRWMQLQVAVTGSAGEIKEAKYSAEGFDIYNSKYEESPAEIAYGENGEVKVKGTLTHQGATVRYHAAQDGHQAGDIKHSDVREDIAGEIQGLKSVKAYEFTIGKFNDNEFFADEDNSLRGTIKVSLKDRSEISGQVDIIVGMEPTILMDFEDYVEKDTNGNVTSTIPAKDYWKIHVGSSSDTAKHGYNQLTPDEVEKSLLWVRMASKVDGVSWPKDADGQEENRIVGVADDPNVRFGEYACKLAWDFSGAKSSVVAASEFGFSGDLLVSNIKPTKIGMWINVPKDCQCTDSELKAILKGNQTTKVLDTAYYKKDETTGKYVIGEEGKELTGTTSYVKYYSYDSDGNVTGSTLGDWAGKGWTWVEADISSYQMPIDLCRGYTVRVVSAQNKIKAAGSMYIDNLQFIYGTNTNDVNKPIIESVIETGSNVNLLTSEKATFNAPNLTFDIPLSDSNNTDKYATGIDPGSIRLYVDGHDYTDEKYDDGSAQTRYADIQETMSGYRVLLRTPNLSKGEHSVKIRVKDYYGNETIETYPFVIDAEDAEDAAVKVEAQAEAPTLGGTFTLSVVNQRELVTEYVDSMTTMIEVSETYGNSIKDQLNTAIQYGNGYEQAAEPVYSDGKITIIAKKKDASESESPSKEIAKITFDIPTDAKEGASFNYSVPEGSYSVNNGLYTFSQSEQKVALTAAYNVKASRAIAGFPVTFTVTDADGEEVENAVIYSSDGTEISNPYTYSEAGRKTVYAADAVGNRSWNLDFVVSAVGTEEDGKPFGMQNNAATLSGSTSEQVTWLSAIGKSEAKALIRYSENKDFSDALSGTGTSKLLSFEQSGKGDAYRLNAVTLSGLKADTTYYYKVGDGVTWSETMTFTTSPAEGDAETDFFIFGDIQTSSTGNLAAAIDQIKKAAETYDFGIQTGDAIDNVTEFNEWKNYFTRMNSTALGGIDVVHTLGNHEYYGDTAGEIAGSIFGLDLTQSAQGSYYSAEYGSVYVGVINNGGNILNALNEAKLDAAKSTCAWKVLVMHQPIYGTKSVMEEDRRKAVVSAIEDAGFDAVFSGDDHAYARTVPMLGDVPQDEDSTDGVVYYVCGDLSGKNNVYTPQEYFAEMIPHETYGGMYMSVKATKESMTLTAYKYNGEQLDSYTIKKSSCELGKHTFDETTRYDTENGTLNCALCGKDIEAADSGYTGKLTTKGQTGEVILANGKLQTGWFTFGEDICHAGDDGILHETKTENTATCTKNGYLSSTCTSCGEKYKGDATWANGHDWDDAHICKICGTAGKDIAQIQLTLNGEKWEYTGSKIQPSVSAYDGSYKLNASSSRYGTDAYIAYSNNINVGIGIVTLEGRGDYYGEISAQFPIVPQSVTEVSAGDVFSTAATLNWTAAAGAGYYRVEKKTADGSWEKIGTTTEPSILVTGLDPETEYTFRVSSRKDIGDETYTSLRWSDALAVTTSSGGTEDAKTLIGDLYALIDVQTDQGTVVQQLSSVTSKEKNYLLLPSTADLSALKLKLANLSGDDTVIFAGAKGKRETRGDEAVINVKDIAAQSAAGEYDVLITVGDSASMVLHVMKSSGVSSLYLTSEDPDNAGRDFVDASKSNIAKGQMVMVGPNGSVVYSGGLKQLKARGNSTFNYYDKKSYQIKLSNAADLLQNGEQVGTWVLLAGYGDATLMHDKLTKDLAADMGMPYVASSDWVDLYYDGVYRGTYLLGEKNTVNATGVHITDMDAAYEASNPDYGEDMQTQTDVNKYGQKFQYAVGLTEPDNITGGYLIERNLSTVDEACGFYTRDGGGFNVKSPEYAGEAAMKYISEYYQEFEDAVYAKDADGNYTGYNEETKKYYYDYVDKESLVKVFLLQELTANVDGFDSSFYFYKDKDGKMYAGPIWDQEMTFGTGFDQQIDANRFWYKNMANALKEIPDFQEAVKAYYADTFLGLAKDLNTTVAAAKDNIADSVNMNHVLWPYMRIGSPTAGNSQWEEGTTYSAVVKDMTNWIQRRLSKLDTMYGDGSYHTVHDYTSQVVKEATSTEEGIKKYTCSICGDSYTESIPKLQAPGGDVAIGGGGTSQDEDVVTNANMESKRITTAGLRVNVKKAADGTATECMTVSADTGGKIVEMAMENKSDSVILIGDDKENKAETSQVSIPTDTIKALVEKTDADLIVKMQHLDLRLDHDSVEALAETCTGETVVLTTAEKADKPVLQLIQNDGTKYLLLTVDKNGQYALVHGESVSADGSAKVVLEAKDGTTYVWLTEEETDKRLHEQNDSLAKLKAGVEGTKIQLRSSFAARGIKLNWTKSKGYKVDYYEVFRSVKRYSGYGKKAYYKTKEGSKKYYINTKEQKKGTRYFYKVRGVRTIDGKKYYTQWSNKAWRIAK